MEKEEETRSEVGDSTEHELGISVYLSPKDHTGFSAVVKARYSDFVVHEVGLDGTVARLDSLSTDIVTVPSSSSSSKDPPKSESGGGDDLPTRATDRKRKRDSNNNEDEERDNKASQDGQAPPELDWTNLEADFSKIVGHETAQRVVQFFNNDTEKLRKQQLTTEKITEEPLFVELRPIQDKNIRRQVHQWIKSSALHAVATADTADDKDGNKVIRFWPLRHERKMPNYGQFDRNGRRIPKHGQQNSGKTKPKRPTGYLQFVLYKENCDTNSAIKQVTQRLGGGHRDGRGGRQNNNRYHQSRVRAGYSGMKDKRGVTTQFCTLHQRNPYEIDWVNRANDRQGGGGNSSKGGFALVRVGNFKFVDEELRLGRLRGNRFDVVLRNVRTNDDHSRETTKDIVLKSAASLKQYGFVNYFGTQRFGKFHDTHLAGILLLKGDFEGLVDIIMKPKEGEQQRIVEERRKWQKRFEKVADDDDTKEARAKAEAACAKLVVRSLGRFMSSEVSILESLSRNPLDYKRAFSCINRTMKMMFLHAVQSLIWNKVASFRIQTMGREVLEGDLVLTQNGSSEEGSKGPSSVKLVTKDEVSAKAYKLEDVVIPLLGTQTIKPGNKSGELFDTLLQEMNLTAEMLQNIQDRDLSCPGDYRKLICRPVDVDLSIVDYSDPFQPLLQTDLMKLNGVPVLGNGCEQIEEDKKLLGVIVGFTLPSSAYATIALRELMKKPTSSEYQKELGLGAATQ